jgi:hypothetical protein
MKKASWSATLVPASWFLALSLATTATAQRQPPAERPSQTPPPAGRTQPADEVGKWAIKTLPTLREHLQQGQDTSAKVQSKTS